MNLDNDLLDLWLMAGMVGGLDEATAKRLIEEVQDARNGLPEQIAEERERVVTELREATTAALDELRDTIKAALDGALEDEE